MTATEPLAVLVVEDDEDDFFLTRSQLRRARTFAADVTWAQTYEDGLDRLRAGGFDVALVDYRLGAHDGLELLRTVADEGISTPIVLLTGQNDLEVDLQASEAGAADYLVKGVDPAILERSIRYARERRRAEGQIRFQASLLDRASDAIVAFDETGALRYANPSSAALFGLPLAELVAHPEQVFTPGEPPFAEVIEALRREREWSGEMSLRRADGRALTVEARWSSVDGGSAYLALFTDVTDRKALEVQFLRSQRMESIGRLVGGIAHDLGNLLVPVVLGAKVLQVRVAGDEKALRSVNMIQKSAQRGADMVKQVLAFARGVEGERVQVRVETVVDEVVKIIADTFPSSVTIDTDVEPDLRPVVGDVTQLQQVLMNLCVNARDAMPDGGRLRIEAASAHLDERYAQANLEARAGEFVRLAVTDTGAGIPRDVLDKIFEPFFTTKAIEKGTGLGLSTVYSIVKSHGGFLSVYSEVGEGTSFSVYLPVAEKPEMTLGEAAVEEHRGAGETILVVDDEPFILDAAQDMLEGAGYRVRTAANGRLGLEAFERHKGEIDLILTDVMMPEMDGTTLIRTLRARGETVPIVAASGMMGVRMEEVTAAGANAFLGKPFEALRLLQLLHDQLHRGGEA